MIFFGVSMNAENSDNLGQKICIFNHFSAKFLYLKGNRTRLLSAESEYTSCQTTQDLGS